MHHASLETVVVEPEIKEQILSDLDRLSPEKQRRAAELVHALATPLGDDEAARQMMEAIEEGCERVDVGLPLSLEKRLELFDEGTERQRQRERERGVPADTGEGRGWTREELYDRDLAD